MISEKDKILIERARTCDNCLCWHDVCNAECCRIAILNIPPALLPTKGKWLKVRYPLFVDSRWYFRMRGVKHTHGFLKYPLEKCKVEDGRIIYHQDCSALKGNLCSGHPSYKPQPCKKLTMNYVRKGGKDIYLTPNCLFRYKLMGEELDEENKKSEEAENKRAAQE